MPYRRSISLRGALRRALPVALLVFLHSSVVGGAYAQVAAPPEGRAMCPGIEKEMYRLAPFTATSCRAGAGSTKETISFLMIAITPVFDDPASKMTWLLSVVGVLGDALNANASLKVDEIIVSDAAQLGDRVAFSLPGPLAKSLQAQLKAGTLKEDAAYAEIQKGLTKKPIQDR